MRVAVVFVVAAVMVLGVEGWGWRAPRIRIPRIPINIPRIPINIPRIPINIPRIPLPRIPSGGWGWPGKRSVRDAEQDAAFNAAAEDGILSDDEIKSVFGVADEDLAEFKSLYDVNDNGEITIEEYQAVSIIVKKMEEEEEEEEEEK